MAENRGKKFEQVIRSSFLKIPDLSLDRLHDQTNGYLGSSNIADFIVYHYPYQIYIECKTVHGNVLPFTNITDHQWKGLLEKSKIHGVVAGVICWWVDHDFTAFIPIEMLQDMLDQGYKSVNVKNWQDYYEDDWKWIHLKGEKKRVFFDYNMVDLLNQIWLKYFM